MHVSSADEEAQTAYPSPQALSGLDEPTVDFSVYGA